LKYLLNKELLKCVVDEGSDKTLDFLKTFVCRW